MTIVVITINIVSVKEAVKSESSRKKVPHSEEHAFLDLLRTTDLLTRRLAPVIKAEDLSATQYNVLRILRGASEGLACGEAPPRWGRRFGGAGPAPRISGTVRESSGGEPLSRSHT